MKTEWWYDDATFHYSDKTKVVLARLLLRDDGSAQILTDGAEVLEFESGTGAITWLVSEEYSRLDVLTEMLEEESIPVDPRIKPPSVGSEEDLAKQMVIDLTPGMNGAPLDQAPLPEEEANPAS